jgi:LPXTG-motif cell wall-anchored protein
MQDFSVGFGTELEETRGSLQLIGLIVLALVAAAVYIVRRRKKSRATDAAKLR